MSPGHDTAVVHAHSQTHGEVQDPADFVKELGTWLLPPGAFADAAKGHMDAGKLDMYAKAPLSKLPDVLGTLGTLRKRFFALNHGTDAAATPAAKLASGKRR